jgi:antitoxin YefM
VFLQGALPDLRTATVSPAAICPGVREGHIVEQLCIDDDVHGVTQQIVESFTPGALRTWTVRPNGARASLAILYAIAYIKFMRATSYTDLRKNLAAMLDSVNADHEPVIITRDRGKPAAVLMSLEDFASFEETRYLLRSPANADRLLGALEELDAGKGAERALIE